MAPKAPRDRGPFRVGEKVLVPHTDKFYVAKALKGEKRKDGWYYLLHYQGWNKKWDEWVEAPGLVKFDQKLVRGDDYKKEGGDGPGKRKNTDVGGGATDAVGSVPQFSLPLPVELREVLLADWERLVKGGGQPRPLPRKPTVAGILKTYVEKASKAKEGVELEQEVADGLGLYFDKALGQMLLYAVERQQYEQAKDGATQPSSLYGGEHLLRLLVKLPELLPMTNLPTDNYGTLEMRLLDFVNYLQEQRSSIFAKS